MRRRVVFVVAAACCAVAVYVSGSARAQSAPPAPTVVSVAGAAGSLTVTWTAPDGGSVVTSYDLRYIESAVADRTDADWTLQEGIWTSGDLTATVMDLEDGVGYDVEVRATNAVDPGAWSATVSASTTDHPNTRSAATGLDLDSSLRGRIDPGDDEDLFEIVVADDTDLWVYTTGDLDTVGELVDSVGDVVVSNDDASVPPGPYNFSLRAEVGAGTYYVSVRSYEGEHTGAYRIHAVEAQPVSTDPAEGTLVSVGSLTPGRLEQPGSTDVFKVVVAEDTDLWVYSIGATDTTGGLYDADGDLIVRANDSSLPGNTGGFAHRARVEAGTYHIRVTGSDNSVAGPYILYVGAVDDPGSSIATAAPLAFELPAPGRIEPAGDQDYFSLALAAPSNVVLFGLAYHEESFPLDIALFDGEGNEASIHVVREDGSDRCPPLNPCLDDVRLVNLRFTATARLAAGTHYFRVTSPDADTGPYMLFPRVDVAANDLDEGCLMRGATQSDPLYGCQWHLNNTGQYPDNTGQYPGGAGQDINVEGVWETTMGEGVNVAVVDSGVDFRHEDLIDNILIERYHDYAPEVARHPSEYHATAVAGLIAASDNVVGVRGVAPRATIYSYRVLAPSEEGVRPVTDADRANAMVRHLGDTAVSNNSWGYPDNATLHFADRAWEMAIERGVKEGYDGKGVFYVFAAGNGGAGAWLEDPDHANFDARANHYGVTAVCAVGYDDTLAFYSEIGANLWVCAPSSSYRRLPRITTTFDANSYTHRFTGTSAATPIVSGVAALLRAANPDLTWRDLKLILAGSARRNDPDDEDYDPDDEDWEKGALKYGSDGEHYWFSHLYGFGVVDAGAAADLADGWTSPPVWREISATSHETVEIPDLIPDAKPMPVTSSVTLDPHVDFVEFIAIEPTLSHTFYRDLRIELTSPAGKTSILTFRGYSARHHWWEIGVIEDATPRFGSAKHLGEDAAGEWTLQISDEAAFDSGTLHGWKLTAYGHGFKPGSPEVSHALPDDHAIRVLWRAPMDTGAYDITGYDLRYARRDAAGNVDASGWTEVTGVWSSGSLFHELDGLVGGARYYVGVRAVTDRGPGPWSESFAAATEAVAPGMPVITGVVRGNGVLLVAWHAPAEDGAADITAYDVQYIETSADGSVDANWTVKMEAWTPGSGSLDYRITELEIGTEYDIQVRAVNSAGVGDWSATRAGMPLAVPDAPTIDSVTAGREELTVEWSAPAEDGGSDITSYDVRYIETSADGSVDANWTVKRRAWTSGDLEYEITGLRGGTEYDVEVRAVNRAGAGLWSATETGRTASSGDATLSRLGVAGVQLSPVFAADVTAYTASVGYTVTRVTIGATPGDGRASVVFVDGDGSELTDADSSANGFQVDLPVVGENDLGVEVTAQDGVMILNYGVTVTRTTEDRSLSPPRSDPQAPFASTATYTIDFQGKWTTDVTPDGRPGGAHFSRLVGGVHNAGVTFLRSGHLAGEGVESMAENGEWTDLRDEVINAGENAIGVLVGATDHIGPTSTRTLSNVSVATGHPRVTLTTMIAPSHDWFVGVSGLALLDAAGRWLRSHEVDLYPWDAGTEQGNDFSLTPDLDTVPQGVITSIRGTGRFTTEEIATLTFTLGSAKTVRSVAENTRIVTDLGPPVAAVASGGTVSYTLGGADASFFDLDTATGQLRTKASVVYDHETAETRTVTVTATDTDGSIPTTVEIAIIDVDEPPVIRGPSNVSYEENAMTEVGTYTASDPEDESVTPLSLSGTDDDYFELSGAGRLTFKIPPDYETKDSYNVTLSTSDGNLTGALDVVVTVTNVNEAPTVTGDASPSFEEGDPDLVSVYSASDPERSPVTLSLVGTDVDNFELSRLGSPGSCVSGSCELRFLRSPDYESAADIGGNNVYEVTVQASDGTNTDTLDVVVTVANVDEEGTVTLSSTQPQMGTELRAVLSDPDGSVSATTWMWERSLSSAGTWSTIGGATEDVFMLKRPVRDYFLRVTASYTDGEGPGKTARAVSANPVQEAPVTNTAPYFPSSETGRREVDENTLKNTLTGREFGEAVAALDDAGDTLTYRLEGTDAASFEIDELSGQLLTEAVLDYEKKRSYSVRVVVTDPSGETARKGVTVTVLNIDEPPDLSGPVAVDYAENRRDMVASYTAVDPEGARIDWTLAGADPDDFTISSRGVLTFGSPPDYEVPTDLGEDNTYEVTVKASDGTYIPTPSRGVTVRVTNLDEDGTVTLMTATSRPQVNTAVVAALDDPDGGISNLVWGWARSTNRRDWTPMDGIGTVSYTPTSDDVGHYLQATATYDDRAGPTKFASAHTAGTVVDPTRPRPPPPPSPPSPPPSPPPPPPGPSSGPGPSGGGGPEPLPPGANHPPEFGEGSRTVRMVAENSPPGTDIGAPVTATDPEGDALAYKLAGSSAGSFDLDSSTGQLKTRAALDYETTNSYTISVEVRDGKNPEGEPDRRRDDSIRVTIMVGNRNDPGWVTLSAPTPRVDQPLQAVLSDPDGDIADLSWRWERSTDQNTWTPIPDTDGASYTAAAGDEGHYLRVTATYSDPHGPGQAATVAPPNPVTVGHTTAFTDIDPEGVHAPAINALAADGIFVDTECGDGLFCSDQPIQRQTMAIWLIRILRGDPPTVGESRFADIAHGQWWIRYAEALADRNIILGCATNPPRYCPDRSVTRAQMASFLVRALQLPEAQTPAGFTDTEGNTHAANIDALAAAGITLGCATDPLRYCPDQPVTRAQMATFLHRALNHQNQRPPTTNT